MYGDSFRVFSRRRIYGRRGGVGGNLVGPDTYQARPGLGLRRPSVWPPHGPTSSPLLVVASWRNYKMLDFCPMQFREYFLWNFSEIQKQQKTGTDIVASCQ